MIYKLFYGRTQSINECNPVWVCNNEFIKSVSCHTSALNICCCNHWNWSNNFWQWVETDMRIGYLCSMGVSVDQYMLISMEAM